MKNFLLAVVFIISTTFLFAQGSQFVHVTVPVNQSGSTNLQGWLYLPKDYNKTKTKYSVVFFYHGKGEAGTNDSLLFRQGLPYDLAHGLVPDSTINPKDGKYYSFIVLFLQSPSWSVNPSYLGKEIDYMKANYGSRIDTNRFYVTGLSAGGQCGFRAIANSDSVSAKIAAAVIMSAASYSGINYGLISKYKIPTWFTCGLIDNVVGLTPTKTYYKNCDSALQGSSNVTWIPNVAHGGWIGLYRPTYRDPIVGLSVWQWLLLYKKDDNI
jgi:predicted peptidase